jgi:ATP/maltotriose-dependent transcriptional regulator MalT
MYRRIGAASGESLSLQRLAVLLTAKGEIDEAMVALDEGVASAERAILRSHCLTRLYTSMVRNRLAAGRPDEAELHLAEGEEAARRHGHCLTCNALLLPETVRVEAARGRIERAREKAMELEAIARRYESRAWTAMSCQARARVLEVSGDRRGAGTAFEAAAAAYLGFGAIYDSARCTLGRARVLERLEPDLAAELVARAKSTFRALGATGIET